MRIAFLINVLRPNGGVGKYGLLLSTVLRDAGHHVQIIHEDPDFKPENNSLDSRFIPGITAYRQTSETKNNEALKALSDFSPDIVHVQSSMNYLLEEKIRALYPAVKSLHVHDYCPSGTKFHFASQKVCGYKTSARCLAHMVTKRCTLDRNPATLWMFYRRAVEAIQNDRAYSKIFVASNYVKNQTLDNGFDPARIEVLPYFTEIPDGKLIPQSKRLIMVTGRMVREKGLEQLLHAVPYITSPQDWRLVVDGQGSDLARLQRLAKKLNIGERVQWAGWLPPDEHRDLYRNASLIVVPSIWPEPFGLVGIEAMSCGKPVVAFRVGGIPDWLEDGKTGFLVEPYDVKDMAKKISDLLNDSERCEIMGQNALKRAEELYTPKHHVQQLLKNYAELLRK